MRIRTFGDYLLGLKLKNVKDSRHSHLEKDSSITAAKLHNITEFSRVQILLRYWPEKVNL